MKPVLAVPVLNRPDLFRRMRDSIDIDVRLLVIDNSGTGLTRGLVPASAILAPPNNLGVAASWNLAIKCYPQEPYWLFANADTEFAPGDLARLVEATESGAWGWVGMMGDWRAFGLTAATVERVGLFDENYHPIYCEDADYERRCTLAGIPWGSIKGATTHAGSVCLSDHRKDNARTYPANVHRFERKWGTGVRGSGGFLLPFDDGGRLADGTQPDLQTLRANAWNP